MILSLLGVLLFVLVFVLPVVCVILRICDLVTRAGLAAVEHVDAIRAPCPAEETVFLDSIPAAWR